MFDFCGDLILLHIFRQQDGLLELGIREFAAEILLVFLLLLLLVLVLDRYFPPQLFPSVA